MSLTFSCGGPGPDPQPGSGKGSVALFVTDNISFYKQVVSTITGVRLINSGTATVCELLKAPVTLDIANLTDIAHYVDVAECPAGSYNRIDVDVRPEVHLMDQLGNTSSCTFTSYFQESGDDRPLVCDPATGLCTVSSAGGRRGAAVMVQEDRYNDLGIDFDLKRFIVDDFDEPSECSVTMAVYPVSTVDMNSSGRAHSVTGGISDLDAAADTFVLTAGTTTLLVGYSGINPALQPDIDVLLQTAQTEELTVNVLTGGIELETASIAANRIYLKVAGTVSGFTRIEGRRHFTLTYGPSKTIAGIQKPQAEVQGAFTDGAWVDVKFDGHDSDDGTGFLATAIEVLPAGTVLDD